MKNLNLIYFSILICFIIACGANKSKLASSQDNIEKKGVVASITCNPLDSFELFFTVENHTDEKIWVGKYMEMDNHEFDIYYPSGIIQEVHPAINGSAETIMPGESHTYTPWVVGHKIMHNRAFKTFDKKNYPTGIYHITWKNKRLDFSTSYDYYFDYDTVYARRSGGRNKNKH